jgi:O-antigen/teichoic acid export membrane protein
MTPRSETQVATLSNRVLDAGLWAAAGAVALQVAKILRTFVLARILSPTDFGVVTVAQLAISVVEYFSQTGFSFALVQLRGSIRPYLDTAWTVAVGRSIVLAGLAVAAAPLVGMMFDLPQAVPMIRVMALSILLGGFANVAMVYYERELAFQQRFWLNVSETFCDVAVGITVGLLTRSGWALVWGVLAGACARLVVSYALHPYRPRFALDMAKARELYRFGRWISVWRALTFVLKNIDYVVVGRVAGIPALGLYRVAQAASRSIVTEMTSLSAQVSFPAYSMLQERPKRLRRAYVRTLHANAFLACPLAAGAIVVADSMVKVVLGPKWLPMIPVWSLLMATGMVRALADTTIPLFRATGRPDLVTKCAAVRLAMVVLTLYPFTVWWGLVGPGVSLLGSGLAVGLLELWIAARLISLPVGTLASAVAYPVGHTALMALVVVSFEWVLDGPLRWLHGSAHSIIEMLQLILVGATSYAAFVAVSVRWMGYEGIQDLREAWSGWVAKRSGSGTFAAE